MIKVLIKVVLKEVIKVVLMVVLKVVQKVVSYLVLKVPPALHARNRLSIRGFSFHFILVSAQRKGFTYRYATYTYILKNSCLTSPSPGSMLRFAGRTAWPTLTPASWRWPAARPVRPSRYNIKVNQPNSWRRSNELWISNWASHIIVWYCPHVILSILLSIF